MAQQTRVFLFGDQTFDFVPTLRGLLTVVDNPILVAFLDQAHYVVRAQMMQELAPAEHKQGRTSSLAHMLQRYVDGDLNPAFQTTLACICQLGYFMRQYGEPGRPYPGPEDNYVLGLCTGSLAAAAISSCSTLSELLPAAVQTVHVAFRLGMCVVRMRDRIETPSPELPREWSVMFSDLEPSIAEASIRDFNKDYVLSKAVQPWITATSVKTTTISGPPGTLRKLMETSKFAKLKSRRIPIFVPSHTSHLFSLEDVRGILETTFPKDWAGYTVKIPIVSSENGKLSWVGNFRGLLERALSDCLLEPLHWEKVEQDFPALLKTRNTSSILINPIATTAERALASSMRDFATVEIDQAAPSNAKASYRPGTNKAKLAIIGTSGRFPEAQDTDAFWDLLYKGLDVCKEVPIKRWNVDTHVDPSGKAHNKGATPWGCWLDFAAEFDPRFFNISPKEAPQMDPAQRMALMSTYEAMERAGVVPDTTSSTQRNRIGVFHGVTSNDWMETNTAQNIDTYFITGGNRGFIPGRINFCFEFSGPSYTNDTACSSSLAAIHLACNSLWRGDCDTAVAGGTNMIFTPDGHAGLDKGFFLSRTGNCKAFDDAADGYCRAEGVGTVFIKRLEDALTDNDPILGVILDTKTNHSAMSDSMTRPHVGAQVDNMTAVLNSACVDANSLDYIEMHGTGTQVGDAVEMESVLTCFAPNESSRPKDRPLHVGSAKANIGHGEGVSGVTSLIKVLLMMKHDTIVPHCGIKPGSKINHNYPDLGARNVHIAFEAKPWPKKQQPRRVLINNFSAAGGNTALLLEDAPTQKEPPSSDPRGSHVFCVSAHVGKSLKKNLQALLSFITQEEANGLSLPQLSWTTTARRWHHLHRVGFVGSSISDIKTKLQNAITSEDGMTRSKTKPNLLMAFTGQGSQYLTMGKQLYDTYPRFRDEVNGFNQLAQSLGFPQFLPAILQTEGEMDDFTPVEAQLAITCLQMALAGFLKSIGIVPNLVVGHSLGEYAALYTAGVLSASDTIYLVGRRAELLQTRCQRSTHAMLAVKAPRAALFELLGSKTYEVACLNGPEDTVLSGTNAQIAAAHKVIASANLKSTQLKLPFAFHSAQVQPVLEELETLAHGVVFHKPTVPVLSPLLGEAIDQSGTFSPAYIARHCRETVNIEKVLLLAKQSQLISDKTVSIEVGPQPLLCGMIKATLGADMLTLPTLQRNKDTFSNLNTAMVAVYNKGYDVSWVAYHQPFKSAHKVIELPSYGWDLKEYWIPYEGDWCLHRHKIDCRCADRPGAAGDKLESDSTAVAVSEKTKVPPVVFESTTCVHTIVEETTAPLGATLVVETDCSRSDTHHVVQGHQVNHIALCTPSVYADIAFTIGKYTMDKLRSSHTGAIDGVVDVSDLVVEKALIPHGQGPQILRTTLSISWPPKAAASARSAKVEFCSMKPDGKVDTKHAWCTVRFVNKSQLHALEKKVPEYRAKVRRLRDGTKKGEFVKYNRSAGYKLMSNVAHFHPDYKLLDNLVLDEATLEACSQLSFDRIQSGGKFYAHPAAVDAITQVGGFAMNAKDSTDLDNDVYVNHGWESFQIYEPLNNGIVYDTYVQMHSDKRGDLCHGDTIVMNGDRVVAFFKGLSLRNVPRKALRMVLQQSFDKGARQNGKPVKGSVDMSVGPAPKPVKLATPPKEKSAPTSDSAKTILAQSAPEASLVKASVILATETASTVQSDNATVIAAINIVAEESGIALEELTDDSNFMEAGIDSLGSMVISSRFREELGLDLDSQFSIFTDLPTVRDLKIFLGGEAATPDSQPSITAAVETSGTSSPDDSTGTSDADTSETEATSGSETEADEAPPKLYPYCKPATSVVLQGIPKVANKVLFMLPDGGGSASSYAPIPRLKADVAIIGLNCPYAREPENMNCTHTAMIESFCNEIRRRQPKGPYHLGGWSSGGAFAYVTAETLVNQGEEVHSLIIIDAPVPQVMEKLPTSFYEYCNTVGLFANQPGGASAGDPPPYLVPHFVAVVDVMMDYKVAPLKTNRMPRIGIVWASETVMDEKDAPKMKGMHFMIQKRADFGPDGWDEVCPGAEFDIVKAEGANHFSLMQQQHINLVSELIELVMG